MVPIEVGGAPALVVKAETLLPMGTKKNKFDWASAGRTNATQATPAQPSATSLRRSLTVLSPFIVAKFS